MEKEAEHILKENTLEFKLLNRMGGPMQWTARQHRWKSMWIYILMVAGFVAYAVYYVRSRVALRSSPPVHIDFVNKRFGIPDMLFCVDNLVKYQSTSFNSSYSSHTHDLEQVVSVHGRPCVEFTFPSENAANVITSDETDLHIEIKYVGEVGGFMEAILAVGGDWAGRHYIPTGPLHHRQGIRSHVIAERTEHINLNAADDIVYSFRGGHHGAMYVNITGNHTNACDVEEQWCTANETYAPLCSTEMEKGEICEYLFQTTISFHGNLIEQIIQVDPLSVVDILAALGGYFVYVSLAYNMLFERHPRSGGMWTYPTTLMQYLCCMKMAGFKTTFEEVEETFENVLSQAENLGKAKSETKAS